MDGTLTVKSTMLHCGRQRRVEVSTGERAVMVYRVSMACRGGGRERTCEGGAPLAPSVSRSSLPPSLSPRSPRWPRSKMARGKTDSTKRNRTSSCLTMPNSTASSTRKRRSSREKQRYPHGDSTVGRETRVTQLSHTGHARPRVLQTEPVRDPRLELDAKIRCHRRRHPCVAGSDPAIYSFSTRSSTTRADQCLRRPSSEQNALTERNRS